MGPPAVAEAKVVAGGKNVSLPLEKVLFQDYLLLLLLIFINNIFNILLTFSDSNDDFEHS